MAGPCACSPRAVTCWAAGGRQRSPRAPAAAALHTYLPRRPPHRPAAHLCAADDPDVSGGRGDALHALGQLLGPARRHHRPGARLGAAGAGAGGGWGRRSGEGRCGFRCGVSPRGARSGGASSVGVAGARRKHVHQAPRRAVAATGRPTASTRQGCPSLPTLESAPATCGPEHQTRPVNGRAPPTPLLQPRAGAAAPPPSPTLHARTEHIGPVIQHW